MTSAKRESKKNNDKASFRPKEEQVRVKIDAGLTVAPAMSSHTKCHIPSRYRLTKSDVVTSLNRFLILIVAKGW